MLIWSFLCTPLTWLLLNYHHDHQYQYHHILLLLRLVLAAMRLRPVVYPQWEITDLKEVAPIPVHYDSDDGESSMPIVATSHKEQLDLMRHASFYRPGDIPDRGATNNRHLHLRC